MVVWSSIESREAALMALHELGRPNTSLKGILVRDHASLALALYPDLVADQCTNDADLAEIHGLRRFFWVQGADGAWRHRADLRREVADEIARRTNH